MGLLSLEHGKVAYRADFVLYGLVIAALALVLALRGPSSQAGTLLAAAAIGAGAWTLIEYAVHHRPGGDTAGFGVTSAVWDRAFGSTGGHDGRR